MTPAVDYSTVKELHRLYEKREQLQRAREECSKEEWWAEALVNVGTGTGGRASVMDALGGKRGFAQLVLRASQERFEAMQADIDEQISDLGGRP